MRFRHFVVLAAVLLGPRASATPLVPPQQQAQILVSELNALHEPKEASETLRRVAPSSPIEDARLTSDELSAGPSLSEAPLSLTEAPLSSSEAPLSSSEAPLSSSETPLSSSEAPLSSSEAPLSSSEAPLSSTDSPVTPTDAATPSTASPSPTQTVPSYPEVTIEAFGTARGTTLSSFLGRPFYAFMSLPYAKPPKRFKNPEKWTKKWDATLDGRYDATYLKARCPQISLILDVTAGREDCLHLSVYTPQLPSRDPTRLPVMVWVHGGAYMSGDAHLYVPTKLMDRDVVVVVVQYRLGLFGFLAGGIPNAPGNMGLMDQIMALRWVQSNIEYFGGNPDLVTIFGQSAGGASASWMQITPLTNGSVPANEGRQLVHHVLPMSGSSLEEWTLDPDPETSFWNTARVLACDDVKDKEVAVACMKDKSMEEVNAASLKIYSDDRRSGGLGFKGLCPVIQTQLAAEGHADLELVIPKSPIDILDDKEFLHVPVMTGSVRDEGSLVVGLSYKDYMYPNHHYVNDTEFARYDLISTLMNAFGIEDRTGSVTNTMHLSYLPNAEMGNWYSMVGGLIDMCGMLFLKSGLWQLSHHMNRVEPDVPIYFYSWEFESDDSLFPWIFMSMPDVPVPGGISHADELLYLFHLPSDMDDRQKTMSARMLTLWTNFAKYGDPTPDEVELPIEEWKEFLPRWKPFDVTDLNFMLIKDNFTNMMDFTTRWNYHIDDGLATTMGSTTTEGSDPVSREEYDKAVRAAEDFKIATAILGALCGCAIFLSIVLSVRMKKTKTV